MHRVRRQRQFVNSCVFAVLAITTLVTAAFSIGGIRPIDFTAAHRPPAPALPKTLRSMLSFPGSLKHYFEKSFATRDLCLELHGRVMVDLLHSSPSLKVVLGKEGWLFFKSQGTLAQYRRVNPFDEQALQRWCKTLATWKAAAAERNADFVVLIAPNKSSVYPEYMDPRYTVADRPARRDQLAAAFQNKIALVDPTSELTNAGQEFRTYHLTDTHWNTFGASIASRELLQKIAAIRGIDISAPTIACEFQQHLAGGDLSRQIGLKRLRPESFAKATLNPVREVRTAAGKPLPRHDMDGDGEYFYDEKGHLVTECAEGEIDSAVIHVDSFGEVMVPMLARHFRRCVFVKGFKLSPKLLDREQPDVLVVEVVERRLMQSATKVFLE